jgi:DNA recombination protein RmuC
MEILEIALLAVLTVLVIYMIIKSKTKNIDDKLKINSLELKRDINEDFESIRKILDEKLIFLGKENSLSLEKVRDRLELSSREEQKQLEKIKESVEDKILFIQKNNAEKLEEMRKTVDEKLHETLEKRLR